MMGWEIIGVYVGGCFVTMIIFFYLTLDSLPIENYFLKLLAAAFLWPLAWVVYIYLFLRGMAEEFGKKQ